MELRRIRQRLGVIRVKSGLKTGWPPLDLCKKILDLVSGPYNYGFVVFFLNIMKLSMNSLTRKSPFFCRGNMG